MRSTVPRQRHSRSLRGRTGTHRDDRNDQPSTARSRFWCLPHKIHQNEGTSLPEARWIVFCLSAGKISEIGTAEMREIGTTEAHPPKIAKVMEWKACCSARVRCTFRLRMPSWIIFWIWLWQLSYGQSYISGRASPRAAEH